jgi:DNA repair exonuclease SbcCD nuclease subunit
MKILHISDLHYKSNTSKKKKSYLNKIVESMADEKIDFVLFTGIVDPIVNTIFDKNKFDSYAA